MSLESKFHLFRSDVPLEFIPKVLPSPFNDLPCELAAIAATQLQTYLETQTDWHHNFGLGRETEGKEIGKMFGVLAVQKESGELGFIAAFSGKLAGGNHHSYFVPPVYDSLKEDGFLNQGMKKLSTMSAQINALKKNSVINAREIQEIKVLRKGTSVSLQRQLFDSYHFLNEHGETKTPWELYDYSAEKMPPSGAGECAAPKLFQYAFQHKLKPLAIAEFWWGKPTKSENQQHKQYYPACKEKCAPILKHMLAGITIGD